MGVQQNDFDLMFVALLDLNTFGNPCLGGLMVAEAELLILGIRPAMFAHLSYGTQF